jgi:hypothetical protein
MEEYLDEFNRHKDVFHQYRPGKKAKRKAEKHRVELTQKLQADRAPTVGWKKLSGVLDFGVRQQH